MMLPPKSGRKVVRLRNAATINKLAQTYTFLMSAWIRTDIELTEKSAEREGHPLSEDPALSEAQDPTGEKHLHNTDNAGDSALNPRKFPNQWREPFRRKIISTLSQLQVVLQQTEMARWEGNLRGHWPHKEYVRLAQVQFEMTACMAQVRSPPQSPLLSPLQTLDMAVVLIHLCCASSLARFGSLTTNGVFRSSTIPKSSTQTSFKTSSPHSDVALAILMMTFE